MVGTSDKWDFVGGQKGPRPWHRGERKRMGSSRKTS